MKVTWIHGIRRLRGASMSKWVDSLKREFDRAAGSSGPEVTIDQIEGIPLPLLRGIVNRYLLYSFHARGLRADLFHIHDHANAHIVPLLPPDSPKIVTVHDLYMLEQPRLRIGSYPFRLFNVPGIKRADHLITVSGHMKEEIVGMLGYAAERISVVYCGIDHSLYRPLDESEGVPSRYGFEPGMRYVLFVGSEIPRKNFPAVARVFKMLCEHYEDLRLVKVGNPGSRRDRETSLREIGGLGLEEKVLFCGFVPEQELPGLYAGAELLLAPSFYEGGSGMHVIEAMACGCPVVASGIPQARELAGGAALHCDPFDDVDILEKARAIIDDEGLRRKMVANGLVRARDFSWERAAGQHLDLYQLYST